MALNRCILQGNLCKDVTLLQTNNGGTYLRNSIASQRNYTKEGQEKLLNSKILIIGAGGLASSAISYLMSVGINTLGVVDFDKVSLNNLPRQIIYDEGDVGELKVDLVKKKFANKNLDTTLKTYCLKLDQKNALDIFKGYDIVLDCVDNFDTKFVINYSLDETKFNNFLNELRNKVNVSKKSESFSIINGQINYIRGVSGFKGQVMMITKESKHDFKSLFSNYPKVSDEDRAKDRGVFPLAVAIVSNIECAEALKYLLGIGEPLIDEVLVIDTIKMNFEKFKL